MRKYKISDCELYDIARQICEERLTVDLAAVYNRVRRSTLHWNLQKRLKDLDESLYNCWRNIVHEHKLERSKSATFVREAMKNITYVSKETGEVFFNYAAMNSDAICSGYTINSVKDIRKYYDREVRK